MPNTQIKLINIDNQPFQRHCFRAHFIFHLLLTYLYVDNHIVSV
jgi:hypothetical protein